MRRLQIGDRAGFRCYDGKIITGKVVSVHLYCYIVIADLKISTMYMDGFFRFTDADVLREDSDLNQWRQS